MGNTKTNTLSEYLTSYYSANSTKAISMTIPTKDTRFSIEEITTLNSFVNALKKKKNYNGSFTSDLPTDDLILRALVFLGKEKNNSQFLNNLEKTFLKKDTSLETFLTIKAINKERKKQASFWDFRKIPFIGPLLFKAPDEKYIDSLKKDFEKDFLPKKKSFFLLFSKAKKLTTDEKIHSMPLEAQCKWKVIFSDPASITGLKGKFKSNKDIAKIIDEAKYHFTIQAKPAIKPEIDFKEINEKKKELEEIKRQEEVNRKIKEEQEEKLKEKELKKKNDDESKKKEINIKFTGKTDGTIDASFIDKNKNPIKINRINVKLINNENSENKKDKISLFLSAGGKKIENTKKIEELKKKELEETKRQEEVNRKFKEDELKKRQEEIDRKLKEDELKKRQEEVNRKLKEDELKKMQEEIDRKLKEDELKKMQEEVNRKIKEEQEEKLKEEVRKKEQEIKEKITREKKETLTKSPSLIANSTDINNKLKTKDNDEKKNQNGNTFIKNNVPNKDDKQWFDLTIWGSSNKEDSIESIEKEKNKLIETIKVKYKGRDDTCKYKTKQLTLLANFAAILKKLTYSLIENDEASKNLQEIFPELLETFYPNTHQKEQIRLNKLLPNNDSKEQIQENAGKSIRDLFEKVNGGMIALDYDEVDSDFGKIITFTNFLKKSCQCSSKFEIYADDEVISLEEDDEDTLNNNQLK